MNRISSPSSVLGKDEPYLIKGEVPLNKFIQKGLLVIVAVGVAGCATNNYTINPAPENVVVKRVPENVVVRLQDFSAREISRVKLVLSETCISLGTSQRMSHDITDINCQVPPEGGIVEAIERALIKYDIQGTKINVVDGIITVY